MNTELRTESNGAGVGGSTNGPIGAHGKDQRGSTERHSGRHLPIVLLGFPDGVLAP